MVLEENCFRFRVEKDLLSSNFSFGNYRDHQFSYVLFVRLFLSESFRGPHLWEIEDNLLFPRGGESIQNFFKTSSFYFVNFIFSHSGKLRRKKMLGDVSYGQEWVKEAEVQDRAFWVGGENRQQNRLWQTKTK